MHNVKCSKCYFTKTTTCLSDGHYETTDKSLSSDFGNNIN